MLKNSEGVFDSNARNFKRYCDLMQDDLNMSKNMPRSRYGMGNPYLRGTDNPAREDECRSRDASRERGGER